MTQDDEPPTGGADSPATTPRSRRRWPWITLWSVVGLLVVIIGLAGWVVLDGLRARDALQDVAGALPSVVARIQDDPRSAAPAIAELQDSAARAAASTSGPHWTVVGWLPWVGDNTRALQTITAGVDTLATDALPPLKSVAASVVSEQLTPVDGRIDLTPLVAAQGPVATADKVVAGVRESIAGLHRDRLVEPLAEAADLLTTELTKAQELTSTAAVATRLLPPMLGADGARDWLILAQTNAETRATGGIPGAALLIRADDGALEMVETRFSDDFGPYQKPVLPLTDEESRLFGPELGLYLQDVNLTPDFPRSAVLARAMWQEAGGSKVDGVLSLDPVAIATVLGAVGPVEFTDPLGKRITLTEDTAASFLMSDVYADYPAAELQDEVFALAARAVFTQVLSGGGDASALLAAMSRIAGEGRLLIWSSDAQEQDLLESSDVAGAIRGVVPSKDGAAPQVGVFLNLTSASKLGYYLDVETTVTDQRELQDGAQSFVLRVRLTSRLESGAVADLPSRVRGNGPADGSISTNLLVYAPAGGDVSAPFGGIGGILAEHDGLRVSALTVVVPPAGAVELEWKMTSGPGQSAPVQVRLTPGARPS